MTLASAARPDEGGGRGSVATVFVCDPTPESERIAHALRSASYTVVELPLSMLVARVAVQRPRVVLIDADNEGALDVVTRVRELADADAIHVLFIARPGGAITSANEALAHEGSGLFVRPVDLEELIRQVDALTSLRSVPDIVARTGTPPPAPPTGPSAALAPPSGYGPLQGVVAHSRRMLAFAHAVSPELQQLLAEAERRVASSDDPEPPVPSPEEEIEAVVPAEWLAALDEPLDDEGEDEVSPGRSFVSAGGRDCTTVGAAPRPRAASTAQEITTGSTSRAPASAPVLTDSAPLTPFSPAPASDAAVRDQDDGRFPSVLGPGDALRVVARAIASRTTGSLCLVSSDAERRIVLREGDVVTASSSLEDESLLAFLVQRGDLPRETLGRVGTKFPPFGRHAAAAVVARGYLQQDQMWAVLRAHAEWLLGRILPLPQARLVLEVPPPGRLASEPSVFGASPGAEVFVEAVRRIVAPPDALERLGGYDSRVSEGTEARLLAECALAPTELERLRGPAGRLLSDVLDSASEGDLATVVFALAELGVVEVVRSLRDHRRRDGARSDDGREVDAGALDADALRERVRARMELVEDGDYFALLGVARDATGYEVRRAFLELRRALDPSRVLTPDVADLDQDLRKIVLVLEEAYEILKDSARRERYRLAIES